MQRRALPRKPRKGDLLRVRMSLGPGDLWLLRTVEILGTEGGWVRARTPRFDDAEPEIRFPAHELTFLGLLLSDTDLGSKRKYRTWGQIRGSQPIR